MQLATFVELSNLLKEPEIEKVKLLAFYFAKTDGSVEFTPKDILSWFANLNLAKPNMFRLKGRLRSSRDFIVGSGQERYRLHAGVIAGLEAKYPELNKKSEEIVCGDTILPASVFEGIGRKNIVFLAKQINAAFENNVFDGCAVLMRRLLEILLILSFQHHSIEFEIKDGNNEYLPLQKIIGRASTNAVLGLSPDTKNHMDEMRELGNYSAHKILYTAKRADIEKHAFHYRVIIEELLIKSGLKT
jgi:hypothetical protein